jgi:hypothetical protein
MAKLLSGTRVYGTATIDAQLIVLGTATSTSTTTGALVVNGGVGIGGNLRVGGTIFGTVSGVISTASTVLTIAVTSTATHFVTFVDANNTAATGEALYTTSTVQINPATGTLSATEINSLSDATLKTNIKVISNSLNIINQLTGVHFDWKNNGKSSSGLIAQDVEFVLPELVNNLNGHKTLNYNGIIGVLVEAVKKLNDKIEYLENNKRSD